MFETIDANTSDIGLIAALVVAVLIIKFLRFA